VSDEKRRLTYDEVDVVLRRAAEIEHAPEAGGREVSAEELERMGAEMGLSSAAVRTALVELRGGALARREEPPTFVDAAFGPSRLELSRTVPGPAENVVAHVDGFMREQLFRIKRNFGERLVWERGEGLFDQLRRGLDFGKRYNLATAREIETSVVPAEFGPVAGAVEVRFGVDMGPERSERVRGAFGGGAGLLALSLVLGAFLPPPGLIDVIPWAAGGLAGGGALFVRGRNAYRESMRRVIDGLERFLDFLERERPDAPAAPPWGAPPPA
jgi:hypothetical protein